MHGGGHLAPVPSLLNNGSRDLYPEHSLELTALPDRSEAARGKQMNREVHEQKE